MQIAGLVGRSHRVWRVNPARRELYQEIPNRLLGAKPVRRVDRLWVGDTTCFRVRGQWLHLAVVMDRFSRRVVGWSAGDNRDNELVCAALRMALRERGSSTSRIFHSDQGIEYAAKAHRHLLGRHGIVQSMSRKSMPYDNAHMESFFKTLKSELVEQRWFNGKAEAVAMIMEYIGYYNRERRHSSLNYISPVEFESKAA
jgi:transposase InsO family protein